MLLEGGSATPAWKAPDRLRSRVGGVRSLALGELGWGQHSLSRIHSHEPGFPVGRLSLRCSEVQAPKGGDLIKRGRADQIQGERPTMLGEGREKLSTKEKEVKK